MGFGLGGETVVAAFGYANGFGVNSAQQRVVFAKQNIVGHLLQVGGVGVGVEFVEYVTDGVATFVCEYYIIV